MYFRLVRSEVQEMMMHKISSTICTISSKVSSIFCSSGKIISAVETAITHTVVKAAYVMTSVDSLTPEKLCQRLSSERMGQRYISILKTPSCAKSPISSADIRTAAVDSIRRVLFPTALNTLPAMSIRTA